MTFLFARQRLFSFLLFSLFVLLLGACASRSPQSALTSGRVRGPVPHAPELSDSLGSGTLVNETPGRLNLEQVRRVVRAHKGDVSACYENEALTNPALEGAIVLSWEILNDGSVSAPMVGHVTLDDVGLEECMLRQIRRWRFPISDSQTSVETFRFDFPP
jgi:hypothetical protein